MSAPYTVRFGVYYDAESAPITELPAAIHRCQDIREHQPALTWPARIFGDSINITCPDGLNRDEREQIDEAMGK